MPLRAQLLFLLLLVLLLLLVILIEDDALLLEQLVDLVLVHVVTHEKHLLEGLGVLLVLLRRQKVDPAVLEAAVVERRDQWGEEAVLLLLEREGVDHLELLRLVLVVQADRNDVLGITVGKIAFDGSHQGAPMQRQAEVSGQELAGDREQLVHPRVLDVDGLHLLGASKVHVGRWAVPSVHLHRTKLGLQQHKVDAVVMGELLDGAQDGRQARVVDNLDFAGDAVGVWEVVVFSIFSSQSSYTPLRRLPVKLEDFFLRGKSCFSYTPEKSTFKSPRL
mmetsp:Transcript_1452/g.2742  ORF Transcript_1452/g.2742 Transcript_1452/m.2742 type:complete len:277 (-) Transcript_1452:154-984(-)